MWSPFIATLEKNTGCLAAEEGANLSSGQELKEAYFIFDDAGDLSTSKHWVKIQRPYLGKGQSVEKYGRAREATAIIEEDKRSYP